jgi:hypothetical protein
MSVVLERHSSEVRANQFVLLACSYVQIPRSEQFFSRYIATGQDEGLGTLYLLTQCYKPPKLK